MAGYFTPNGTYIEGQKLDGTGGQAKSAMASDIETAANRCQLGADAGNELRQLFNRWPRLKEDRWEIGKHPASPVVEWFTKQRIS